MPFPYNLTFQVPQMFNDQRINLNLYSGLTILVGPNGSGKTQLMRAIKRAMPLNKLTRYLSSNRIGELESHRSQTIYYATNINAPVQLGSRDYLNARHNIEVATGDFFAMDARKDIYIKVEERLRILFNREIYLRWDNGQLFIYFSKVGSDTEYSVSVEASGLINLISILAALYDDEVGILLIDEPEVSFHPQLQSFVLKEIKKVAGDPDEPGKKLIIIATHSTDMLDIRTVESLPNLVFFISDSILPIQINPDAEELRNIKIKELIPRLGQLHKSAFFVKQPILVEGITDSILCNYFDERFDMYLGAAGSQIVPIDGKGQFAAVIKLMRLIGKTPIVIADLDAFIDDNDLVNLFVQDGRVQYEAANIHGHRDIQTFVKNIKTDFCSLCEKNWDTLHDVFETHPYWKNRKKDDDIQKIKKRAALAILMSTNSAICETWQDYEAWLNVKNRLVILMNCLEKAGCFILRYGAIESYYLFSNRDTSEGKPSAVINEIESLKSQSSDYIDCNYGEFIRALKFASTSKNIDESDAIKKELLSEIAPIIHILSAQTTISDIKSIVKQSRGTNKSLFEYEIVNENARFGIKIKLQTRIIEVNGFPFTIYKGDNVNDVINQKITPKI